MFAGTVLAVFLIAAAPGMDGGAGHPPDAAAEFPVTLGAWSTTLAGSQPARTANLRLAAAALDGAILAPGEELSFNRAVGPRTLERGYQNAPVILREERQLQLGGGICQAASTVFCAALLSGLTITERSRHSSPVDYIPLGYDATIAWGYKDLRVRNDLEQRVRLRIEVLGATLGARFEAEQPEAATFELAAEERDVPAASDEHVPGREIELYRLRREAGEETSREFVHRDHYPSVRGHDRAAPR
jgi:vancomycin resistance protein YoaR